MESWFDHHWPQEAPRHQPFISELLKHVVALDFNGQDTGFSVFAVCLLGDNADPVVSRASEKPVDVLWLCVGKLQGVMEVGATFHCSHENCLWR